MKKIKLLMIGVFISTSTNCSQVRGFENNQCEVIKYDYRERLKKLGNSQRNIEIINICKKENPDLIFTGHQIGEVYQKIDGLREMTRLKLELPGKLPPGSKRHIYEYRRCRGKDPR